jgi:sulfoxide reductase heme-binding subunit YedZ
MAAFVLLVPLAITSTNAMIRRLGALNWRRLHKLVFPAVVLGAVHFVLLVKALSPEPFIYLGLAVLLTGWRLVPKARR